MCKVYIVTDGELKHNKQQQLEDGTSRLGWQSRRTCVYIIAFYQKNKKKQQQQQINKKKPSGSYMLDMDTSKWTC